MNQFNPKIAEAMEHALKVQKIMTELGHTKYTICGIASRQMLHDSEQEVSVLLGKLHKVTEQRDEARREAEKYRNLMTNVKGWEYDLPWEKPDAVKGGSDGTNS